MNIYDPESSLYLFEDEDFYGHEQYDGIQTVHPDVPDAVLERLVSYDISYREFYSGRPYCNFTLVKERADRMIDKQLKESGMSREELKYRD
ncbi:MAG: hypothetical protein ACOX6W_17335 [Lentisphaeria bacterium]|jgi:hypothetical protein